MLRYARHERLEVIGKEGQKTFSKKKVLIVGVGALGSTSAMLLARAGIGKLVLVDFDVVKKENLTSQVLYTEKEVGKAKVLAAKQALNAINPKLKIITHKEKLGKKNVEELVSRADVVIDGTDNMLTRYIINDACVKNDVPWVFGAALETRGMIMPVMPGHACLQCVFPEVPSELTSCEDVGVLNTLTTSIATLQATLAIRILLGEKPKSELYSIDVWLMDWSKISVKKNKKCKAHKNEFYFLK